MTAILGAIREHRVAVMLTGSLTLVMFLSIIFVVKENKSLNVSLLTLLAISVQSLIFSEMLKERYSCTHRRTTADYLTSLSRANGGAGSDANSPSATGTRNGLTAVVVYQTQDGAQNGGSSSLFMIDSALAQELQKDPPPSYFSTSCPPPKYEDAIKMNASEQSLPVVNAGDACSVSDMGDSPSHSQESPQMVTPMDSPGTCSSESVDVSPPPPPSPSGPSTPASK